MLVLKGKRIVEGPKRRRTSTDQSDREFTKESTVKQKVRDYLNHIGAYYEMRVMTYYGKKGLDFTCCIKGRWISIETKRPGKVATPAQEAKMTEIRTAGGFAICSDDIEQIKLFIQAAARCPLD